jgi:cleavage and polyadenylation specificity factor subunit 1
VYIKGLDYDDRLLALAFADVGLFVTSISVFKNLILFGDAFKSMWFASLQVSYPLLDQVVKAEQTGRAI